MITPRYRSIRGVLFVVLVLATSSSAIAGGPETAIASSGDALALARAMPAPDTDLHKMLVKSVNQFLGGSPGFSNLTTEQVSLFAITADYVNLTEENVSKFGYWLRAAQHVDGGWARANPNGLSSLDGTALAIMALSVVDANSFEDHSTALARGVRYAEISRPASLVDHAAAAAIGVLFSSTDLATASLANVSSQTAWENESLLAQADAYRFAAWACNSYESLPESCDVIAGLGSEAFDRLTAADGWRRNSSLPDVTLTSLLLPVLDWSPPNAQPTPMPTLAGVSPGGPMPTPPSATTILPTTTPTPAVPAPSLISTWICLALVAAVTRTWGARK